MSAIGLYQVSPGIPVYALGRPIVDKATLPMQKGTLEILVHNNSAANKYVKEVKWNGKPLDMPFIAHAELIQGGKLEFTMSDTHE